MAEPHHVDGNTQLPQEVDQQELKALNVVSVHVDQENLNQNEVKEQEHHLLLDRNVSPVKEAVDSLPSSKEWAPCNVGPSDDLHQIESLTVENIDTAMQKSKEMSVVNEQIQHSTTEQCHTLPHMHCNQIELQMVNEKALEVPESGNKESVNQRIEQKHGIAPQSKCEETEKAMVVQKQTESPLCVTCIKKQEGQQAVEQNQISVEMKCSVQESSDKPNQGSRVIKQVKEMQNQQAKKQKTGMVGENHERINYLVQVSRTIVNLGQSKDESTALNFDKPLASQTGSLATAVGRKSLIRLSPSLKRNVCKGCGTMLIYGVNARVRQRCNRQRHLVITCLVCNTVRRLVCDVRHKLWCEQEEAVV